jgi:MerR family copper efflux transcriptional regulator
MRIGELAEAGSVSTKTIRYYESLGLLAEPERTSSGYRVYHTDAQDRLSFIRDAQATGSTVAEISSALELKNSGEGSCAHTRDLLDRHLVDLDTQIERLIDARTNLRSLANRGRSLDPRSCTDPNRCQIIGISAEKSP